MTAKTKTTIGRVQISDDALMNLYRRLRERGAPADGSFTALDAAGRREYFRVARRRARARAASAKSAGALEPNTANVRDALADAALMMLATDADGAGHIRTVLAKIFAERPGVPFSVETKARQGKLKPKLLQVRS
jgi:hypothetical protein